MLQDADAALSYPQYPVWHMPHEVLLRGADTALYERQYPLRHLPDDLFVEVCICRHFIATALSVLRWHPRNRRPWFPSVS